MLFAQNKLVNTLFSVLFWEFSSDFLGRSDKNPAWAFLQLMIRQIENEIKELENPLD